jgi:hypothetical protein
MMAVITEPWAVTYRETVEVNRESPDRAPVPVGWLDALCCLPGERRGTSSRCDPARFILMSAHPLAG